MKNFSRGFMGLARAALLVAAGGFGCSNESGQPGGVGQLALPLSTQGASGTEYRLRDAVFEIASFNYDPWYGTGGFGGGPAPKTIVVSSETDPSARTISVNVAEGQYLVTLRPGWRLEQVTASGATTVEATLLTEESTWVYVWRLTTTFAEFHLGLGERSIWLNGNLNIEVRVSETPPTSGGVGGFSGGAGGYPGIPGGMTWGGSPASAGYTSW